jgi:hypothetical protein
LVLDGLEVAVDADGTNADDFTVGTGNYFVKPQEKLTIGSIFYSAGVGHGEDLIHRYFHTASAWDTEYSNGVDFAFYDNGTQKTGTAAGKWYCAFVFVERDDHFDYMYPQVQYSTEGAALAAPVVYPPDHDAFSVLLGRFVFKHGVSAFGSTSYFVDARPIHGSVVLSGAIQTLWKTVTGDSGSDTADASDDSLAVVGGTGITTAVTANTVTITGHAAPDQSVDAGASVEFSSIVGGTGSGDHLFLDSTSHGTKGHVQIGVGGTHVDIGDHGSEDAGVNIGGVIYDSLFRVHEYGGTNPAQAVIHRHSTTLGPILLGARSNSDTAGHAAVTDTQETFRLIGAGWTGAEYNINAEITFEMEAGTISNSSSPGAIKLKVTPDGATVAAAAVTVNSDKSVFLENTLELGHATDTTLARTSAGVVSIEGSNIIKASDVDDTPDDGDDTTPPSANWAYDHATSNPTAHHTATAVDDTPDDDDTASAPTANWAYDHAADATAHQTVTHEKCLISPAPVDTDDNIPVWSPNAASTVIAMYCRVEGGTNVVGFFSDGTNALDTMTCIAGGQADDGSIANATFSADERFEWDTTSVSGEVDWFNICITYTVD